MRMFYVYRSKDRSGPAGSGFIAQGVVFDTGKCALSRLGVHSSIAIFDRMEDLRAAHCSGNDTEIVYEDDDYIDSDGRVWVLDSSGYVCVSEPRGGPWWPNKAAFEAAGMRHVSEWLKDQAARPASGRS